jgi:polyhydroxyalkanoate synthesis regulator phasin
MTLEEKFFSMAESSEKAIEDFNDFADDRAVVWAAKEIRHLREMVKEIEVMRHAIMWEMGEESPNFLQDMIREYEASKKEER